MYAWHLFVEVQRVPELLSYLKVDVDAVNQPGRWILATHDAMPMAADPAVLETRLRASYGDRA